MYIGGMMLNSYTLISKNKLFVWSLTVVLTLLLAFHIFYFEKFSYDVLKKEDLSAKRFLSIKNQGDNIKVSAIGTSHTGSALYMDRSFFFNYGRATTWYPQVAYAKVSHLLQYATNLKVLLLEVDHIDILYYNHLRDINTPRKYDYLLNHVNKPLNEGKRYNSNAKKSIFLLSLQKNVSPGIHRKYLQEYIKKKVKQKKVKQKKQVIPWATLSSKEKVLKAKRRILEYGLENPLVIDSAVCDYYRKAIRAAKKKGVKVYLIFYPQTQEYLEGIHEKNNLKVDNFVFDLANDENISVLDYRHYFISDESSFSNQDHVNGKGGKALTQEVLKVIKDDI